MTKKDYKLIAKVFADTRPNDDVAYWAWDEVLDKMAQKLGEENPKFNPKKFLKAADPS